MHAKGRALLPLVLGLFACDASCGTRDREALGHAVAAHDCAPDVAVCIGGEAFLSVGGAQGQGDPCRQLSLGACDRGCVDEGVPVAYVGKPPAEIRAQLCDPSRGVVLATPVAAPSSCAVGTVTCLDGVVQRCGHEAARCERGCATDDVLTDELELTMEQAIRLFCAR